MQTETIKNATQRQISGPGGLAARLIPFEGSNLRGITGAYRSAGRMSADTAERYRADAAAGRIAYTVVSYSTPIAWVRTDGTVVRPDDKYSVTSSRHMSRLAWLGQG